jgi:hypothetical protein
MPPAAVITTGDRPGIEASEQDMKYSSPNLQKKFVAP